MLMAVLSHGVTRAVSNPAKQQQELTAGAVRDVRLAVVAHDAAVCIGHHQRVEVGVAGPLKEGDCGGGRVRQ